MLGIMKGAIPPDYQTTASNSVSSPQPESKGTAEEILDKKLQKARGEFAWYIKQKPGFKEVLIEAMLEFASRKVQDRDTDHAITGK